MASLVLPQQTRLDVAAALTASGGVLNGVVAACYQVNVTPTDQTKLADLIGAGLECNFDGYARSSALVWGPDVFYSNTGVASIYAGVVNFQSAADQTKPQTIFGTALLQNTTPIGAPTQTAPSTATTGGSIAAGTYYYKVTTLDGAQESVGSNEESQTTTGATSTVTINWGAVSGATGYKIYRGSAAGAENLLIATVGPSTSYTETGGETTSAASPPATAPSVILRAAMLLDAPVPINNYPDGLPFLARYDFAG